MCVLFHSCSYFALVDNLRKAPASFTRLHYHSQLPYKFTPRDDKPRLIKFRLVPADGEEESGLLCGDEQQRPWDMEVRE